MNVGVLNNIFVAGKRSEIRVTPAQCGWVHMYLKFSSGLERKQKKKKKLAVICSNFSGVLEVMFMKANDKFSPLLLPFALCDVS